MERGNLVNFNFRYLHRKLETNPDVINRITCNYKYYFKYRVVYNGWLQRSYSKGPLVSEENDYTFGTSGLKYCEIYDIHIII